MKTKQEMQRQIDKLDNARAEAERRAGEHLAEAARLRDCCSDYEAVERAFPADHYPDKRTVLTRIQDALDARDGLVVNAATALAETKAVLRTLAVEHWGEDDAAVKLQFAVHGVPPTIDGDA